MTDLVTTCSKTAGHCSFIPFLVVSCPLLQYVTPTQHDWFKEFHSIFSVFVQMVASPFVIICPENNVLNVWCEFSHPNEFAITTRGFSRRHLVVSQLYELRFLGMMDVHMEGTHSLKLTDIAPENG